MNLREMQGDFYGTSFLEINVGLPDCRIIQYIESFFGVFVRTDPGKCLVGIISPQIMFREQLIDLFAPVTAKIVGFKTNDFFRSRFMAMEANNRVSLEVFHRFRIKWSC